MRDKRIKFFPGILTQEQCSYFFDKVKETEFYTCIQVHGSTINRYVTWTKEIFDIVQPTLEEALEEELIWDGGAIRYYRAGDWLKDHKDVVYQEYWLSINLAQSDDRENFMHIYEGDYTHRHSLAVGDGLIFPGSEYVHGREPFTADYTIVALITIRNKPKHLI